MFSDLYMEDIKRLQPQCNSTHDKKYGTVDVQMKQRSRLLYSKSGRDSKPVSDHHIISLNRQEKYSPLKPIHGMKAYHAPKQSKQSLLEKRSSVQSISAVKRTNSKLSHTDHYVTYPKLNHARSQSTSATFELERLKIVNKILESTDSLVTSVKLQNRCSSISPYLDKRVSLPIRGKSSLQKGNLRPMTDYGGRYKQSPVKVGFS